MSTVRYIEAAGTRVYLQEWAADDADANVADAPTLLCLHGLGGGSHFFSALGPALARAHRCRTMAIDFPGSGLSPFPAFTSVSAQGPAFDLFVLFAAVVVDLVRREGLSAPYILGHSMGTIVALDAIRQAPEIAGGLIVVGGLAAPLPEARARILARAREIRRSGMIGMGERVVAGNFAQRTQDERPEVTGLFAHMFAMQHAASYAATSEALARWTARPIPTEALANLRCLVVTGDEDHYAPPDAVREFAGALPAGTAVEIMPECGHLPFLEQPAAFAALIGRFLTSS
jgi:pimeloyl-ACP methyl ester carboxylesterase